MKMNVFLYYICHMISNLNIRSLYIGTITFLFCLSSAFGQEPDKKDEAFFIETTETVSPFEVPTDTKFSQEIQTKYTDLLSRLFNDRNTLNKSLAELKKQKNTQLNLKDNKDITLLNTLSTNIKSQEQESKSVQFDIDELKSALSKTSSNKEAAKVINSILKSRYPESAHEKEVIEDWDKEFDYIKDDNTKSISNSDCSISFNGIDPNSLEKKVQTGSENLISYTHPKLEEYYKKESFLTGDVSLIEMGKNTYMAMNIIIRSRDALKNYGMIQAGSPLKVELINGEAAYLFAISNATGRPIANTSNIFYQAIFKIEKSEFNLLKKSEIDNVGVMWSSGYEKYDVYNIDVILRQISCLENL